MTGRGGSVVARRQLHGCFSAVKNQSLGKKREERKRLDLMQEQTVWIAQYDTAATLANRTIALPLAQKAASCEGRHVGSVCQFLVGDVEFNAAWNLTANTLRKTRQYPCKSLSGRVADQRHVRSLIPRQIVRGN